MSHAARRYAIIEAPSNLGLRPTGVEKLAERMLAYGLADRIRALLESGRAALPGADGHQLRNTAAEGADADEAPLREEV